MGLSKLQRLAAIPEAERQAFVDSLSQEDALELLNDWDFLARPEQLEPAEMETIWAIVAGRGFGKTRAGAEFLAKKCRELPGSRAGIFAATAGDVRDTCVEGVSGLLEVLRDDVESWDKSLLQIKLTNGSQMKGFGAGMEPDRVRGPQFHWGWADEWAAWRYPTEALTNITLALRLGEDPRMVITTTPRATRAMKELMDDESIVVTGGSTYENTQNLAPTFRKMILGRYEGTRIGRQELYAELLEDVPGALLTIQILDGSRVTETPALSRVVIALDPAVTATENSDESGLVVVALGEDHHAYILEDLSAKMSAMEWAGLAVRAYHRHEADEIVAEVNNGGDLVEEMIHQVDPSVRVAKVHASRSKYARAQPVAGLYEQGRIHHVGTFRELEDQWTTWVVESDYSPDRLDAEVWGVRRLLLDEDENVLYYEEDEEERESWDY